MYNARTLRRAKCSRARSTRRCDGTTRSIIYARVTESGQPGRGHGSPRYTGAAMFPVSDVIPSRTTPYVTIGLIVVNTLAFLVEWQMSDRELEIFLLQFGAVPAYLTLPSIVTSMFLHGGWLHFGGNMLYLWIFG